MCGITGIFAFNLVGKFNLINITAATQALHKRGPDNQGIYTDSYIGLGHRRLSIIDTSPAANQPLWDSTHRYCLVFNGEIFNYLELKQQLKDKGVVFSTHSDSEVLLQLYIREKENCLSQLNGFFAFCVYDLHEQSFFVARDRYGIKPLLYVFDEDKFLFASEMKSILQYGIEKTIDYTSLFTYLQLNYIPAPHTIFTHVKKLLPGHWLRIRNKKWEEGIYYQIRFDEKKLDNHTLNYEDTKVQLKDLLEASVQRRLIADVPLGAFLSGGIDSSVVTGLASKHKSNLHTFSIGFRDEKFFDETEYAKLVAAHFKTDHTVFSLTNTDLYEHIHSILDYIDEPFADSSAIAVYILSRETRKYATVALSGDGADELLAGYNKHAGFLQSLRPGFKENLVKNLLPLWNLFPASRNNSFTNKVRQLKRFAEGMNQSPSERYWQWASFASAHQATTLLSNLSKEKWVEQDYQNRKAEILKTMPTNTTINDVLLTDMRLVLANDMLTKVDLMSMANALEVRIPFLDFEVVNFLFSLPDDYKINSTIRKKILQDTFKDLLPPPLYNRRKKGFEVPLLKWFRGEMKPWIVEDLLAEKFIVEQGIFSYTEIAKLKAQLFSSNPGDIHARIWGLIVFQSWWKKTMRL